ncbi:MAG: hypothetical protein JNJ45_05705 [Chthonomonas sp.]|nr:hypothetical protein [Chthonomonas sp.]
MLLATITACLALTTVSAKKVVADSWSETLVIGHRGAASVKPENTLPAFEEAIASGAAATECDIRRSRDGEMMVIHDATLDRTTKIKGAVNETAAQAMREAGVPDLGQLMSLTSKRIVLVIEIKDGDGIERRMVDLIRARKMEDQVIIFSFHAERMAEVERLNPKLITVLLHGGKIKPEELANLKTDGIGVHFSNCDEPLARAARERKLPLFVWTVPPGPEVDRLRQLGVNFIITDHPREVRAQLGR